MIIPCGAAKAARPARARDLYTGQQFRLTLAAALEQADPAHVLILSARHGLIALDQVVAPYDTKMGDPDSVTAEQVRSQLAGHGITWGNRPDVYAMLPKAYWAVLDAACRAEDIYPADVYEAAPGIGYQRQVASIVARPTTQEIAA